MSPRSFGKNSRSTILPFADGILIVVPNEIWLAAYADRALVMSAENVESHSNWATGKGRVKEDTRLDCLGILHATGVFIPALWLPSQPADRKSLIVTSTATPSPSATDRSSMSMCLSLMKGSKLSGFPR